MAGALDAFDAIPTGTVAATQPPQGALSQFDAIPLAAPSSSPPPPVTLRNRATAPLQGFNSGLAAIAGLPVDTALNVWDLAKAAIGAPVQAITGKPQEWAAPSDRSQYIGSSEQIKNALRNRGLGYMVDLDRPDDTTSRMLYPIGQGSTAAIGSGAATLPALLRAGALGGLSNMAGQVAYDQTGSPAAAIAASFATPAAANATGNAALSAARGDMLESAANIAKNGLLSDTPTSVQQAMRTRMDDAANSGVQLTVGQATNRPLWEGAENIARQGLVGRKTMQAFDAKQASAVQNTLGNIADNIDPARAAVADMPVGTTTRGQAGSAIQQGVQDWDAARSADMDSRVDQFLSSADIQPWERFGAPNFQARLGQLLNPAPFDSPAVQNFQVSGYAKGLQPIADALAGESQTIPASPQTLGQRLAGVNGVQQGPQTIQTDPGGLTFQSLWNLRKKFGADGNYLNLEPSGQRAANSLYGPTAQDLATIADQRDAGQDWRSMMGDFENQLAMRTMLDPYHTAQTPEQAFDLYKSDWLQNPSRFAAVRDAVGPDAAKAATAEVVSRLGQATPGQQGAEGDNFSVNRLLTDVNSARRNDPRALGNLAATGGTENLPDQLAPVLRTAENIKNAQKILSNPSGTAHTAGAMGVALEGGRALGSGDIGTLAKVGGGLLAMGLMPKVAYTNQDFINLMRDGISPQPQSMLGLLTSYPYFSPGQAAQGGK